MLLDTISQTNLKALLFKHSLGNVSRNDQQKHTKKLVSFSLTDVSIFTWLLPDPKNKI